MSLKRKQILDAIGRTNPTFHKIAEGYREDEEDNVFDAAFRAINSNAELEIEENTMLSYTIVETNIETFGFSQFLNSDMQPSGPYQPLPRNSSIPNLASPFNFVDAICQSLLFSNTTSDHSSDSQIAAPCLYTGMGTGTDGFQDVPIGPQQHGLSDSSEELRLQYAEPRETELYLSSPVAANPQTPPQAPASALLFLPFSPATLAATSEFLRVTQEETSTQRGKRKIDPLNTGRTEKPPPPAMKKRRKRIIRIESSEEGAARLEKKLGRNRRAAQKCRQTKKTSVAHLLKRAASLAIDNAQHVSEIELLKKELEELKAMAVEHYRVCSNPGPEPRDWFVREGL